MCIYICVYIYMKVKVLVVQLCPTLCDSMDCSLSGSSVHGIVQARILEWVAIPFSRGCSQPRDQTWVSCIAGRFFTIYTQTHTYIYILFWILFHYESESCSVVSNFLWPHGLYRPWNSPGQNTKMGSCSLLQGIFPTQGLNPGLPHCRQILYHLSHISIIG